MEDFWSYLPSASDRPTCFQIRLGGFKGMLGLDTRLIGKTICLRKGSMMKFPSHDLAEIGICDVASKPLRLVLNRQIIKILEDMGTKDEWFMRLQKRALDILRKVTSTAQNTAAFIKSQNVGSSIGLPKFINQLAKFGIDYRKDSFLRPVVENVVLRELRLLKHKARIPVSKGVTLFGIMDETGFLQKNQVYVAYSRTGGGSASGIDSNLRDVRVLVTRSPALHPGDIQGLIMVMPPAVHPLRELRNCIVFSQHGERDNPSILSGGDLDGDLYNVIWDEGALPDKLFKPADYPRVAPQPLNRPVERHDIADFFIDFMKTDCLGMIAIRHQILADYNSGGTVDPDCITLAGMHSTAVDFSKTGIPVDFKAIPRGSKTRPDL